MQGTQLAKYMVRKLVSSAGYTNNARHTAKRAACNDIPQHDLVRCTMY